MFIKSVKFHIRRSIWGLDKTKKWMNLNPEMPTLPDESWYFERVMSSTGFVPLDFSAVAKESIIQIAKNDRSVLFDKIKKIVKYNELIQAFLSSINIDFSSPLGVYVSDAPQAIILRLDDNCFFVLSVRETDGQQIVERLQSCFIELKKTVTEFGYTLDNFVTGRTLARQQLESKKEIASIKTRESKNDLEKRIIEIVSQVTDSYLSNLEIVFKNPAESFEYDLVLLLHEKVSLNIEVMDYSNVKNELRKMHKNKLLVDNLKSNVLLRTFDKANRLGIDSVIVLKGFPKDVFLNIQQIAESRGIILVDSQRIDEILSIIVQKLSSIAKSPTPSFDDFVRLYRERLKSYF